MRLMAVVYSGEIVGARTPIDEEHPVPGRCAPLSHLPGQMPEKVHHQRMLRSRQRRLEPVADAHSRGRDGGDESRGDLHDGAEVTEEANHVGCDRQMLQRKHVLEHVEHEAAAEAQAVVRAQTPCVHTMLSADTCSRS